jgi:hypothetical protein
MLARVYDATGQNAITTRLRRDGRPYVSVIRFNKDGYMVPERSYDIEDMDRLELLDHLDSLERSGYLVKRY